MLKNDFPVLVDKQEERGSPKERYSHDGCVRACVCEDIGRKEGGIGESGSTPETAA